MILVTGGTGMLGAHLLVELALRGKKVKALKRAGSSTKITEKIFSWYAIPEKDYHQFVEWVTGDLNDPESIFDALNGVTHVYHVAAVVSFSVEDDEVIMRNNITGTANLVNACLEQKIKKLSHVSSVAALGVSQKGQTITENNKWQPSLKTSGYAQSKFYSELEVWKGIAEGMDAVILNPSVIIGPGNWNHGSPSLIKKIKKGLRFYPKGTTGFVDVRDVVKCMIALMESQFSGERFIINSENVTYKNFFSLVAGELKVRPPNWPASRVLLEIAWRLAWLAGKFTFSKPVLTKYTARSGRNTNHYSNDKIKKLLSFTFIPIEESIKHTCNIFKKENQ